MTIRKITALLFLTLITVYSCKKDTEEFIVIDNGATYTARIVGIVLDENKLPMEGATATFNGSSATSDRFGVYEFTNVKVGDQHNFISISKNGYFDGFRTFRTDHEGVINQKTELIRADYNYSFNASTAEEVVSDKFKLEFPANSIIDEATGNAYKGSVDLAMNYIGPNDVTRMPGDLSATDENGETLTLTSYGMVKVSMKGDAGQKLQVKEGSTVAMTADIPDDILSDAPSEIPMWHFNTKTGFWDKEGLAIKIGNQYEADIPHFSTWNLDHPSAAVVISGRLVNNEGNPISAAQMAPTSSIGRGSIFSTNEDGTFSTLIPRDQNVSLFLSGIDCINPYAGPLLTQVGGFQNDAKVGDILVNNSEDKTLEVTGTFLNCNDQPIEQGFIEIAGLHFTLSEGTLNLALLFCDQVPSELAFKVYDRATSRTSLGTLDVTSNSIDLGTIKTCLLEEEFFKLECPTLGVDTDFLEIEFDDDEDEVHIKVINGNEQFLIGAYYDDIVGTNTYELHDDKYIDEDGIWYRPRSIGTITIEKNQNIYTGTITAYLGEGYTGGETHTFNASFTIGGQ